jgi:hypothetical protein
MSGADHGDDERRCEEADDEDGHGHDAMVGVNRVKKTEVRVSEA